MLVGGDKDDWHHAKSLIPHFLREEEDEKGR